MFIGPPISITLGLIQTIPFLTSTTTDITLLVLPTYNLALIRTLIASHFNESLSL